MAARGGVTAIGLSMLLGACVVASACPSASASTAPTGTDLTAQTVSLQAQIVSNGQQLHALAGAMAETQQQLAGIDTAITVDEASLASLHADLAHASETLRGIALNQYMQDADTQELADFVGSADQIAAANAYQQLATAQESDAVASFLQAHGAVQRQEAQLEAERAAASNDYASVSSQYTALEASAQNEQVELNQNEQVELNSVRAEQAAMGTPHVVDLAILAGNGSPASDLYRVRMCESGDNYQENTGNGYYGAYQFALSTWDNLGYGGLPSDAPPSEQDQAATTLVQRAGWGQWPGCAAMLGLD